MAVAPTKYKSEVIALYEFLDIALKIGADTCTIQKPNIEKYRNVLKEVIEDG